VRREVPNARNGYDGEDAAEREARRDGTRPRFAVAGMCQLLAVARAVSGEEDKVVRKNERDDLHCGREGESADTR